MAMPRTIPSNDQANPSIETMNSNDSNPPPSPHDSNPPPSPRQEEGWAFDGAELSPREDDHENTDARARFPSTEEALPPLPQRAEPTLKEKLVERERQARVERERARLKRQFALSSNGGALHEDDGMHAMNGSVVGTVGEGSSVAAAHLDDDDDEDRKELGYAMERFLSQSGAAAAVSSDEQQQDDAAREAATNVLMKRFLAEPVLVEQDAAEHAAENENNEPPTVETEAKGGDDDEQDDDTSLSAVPELRVSNTIDTHDVSLLEATAGSLRSYSTVTNTSGNAIEDDVPSEEGGVATTSVEELDGSAAEPYSPSQPRRLTEAEIQEMAAIEEASIGNAPPSERGSSFSESSSVVGDLLADVGGRAMDVGGDFISERTTTTALESTSGCQSEPPSTQSVDGTTERASVSSHLLVSPGASIEGSISITACPPSEIAAEDPSLLIGSDVAQNENPMLGMPSFDDDHPTGDTHDVPSAVGINAAGTFDGGDVEATAVSNAGIMNRQLRPGKIPVTSRILPTTPERVSAVNQLASTPDNAKLMLDGFDYDKNAAGLQGTPHSTGMDSYNDLPGDDPWSPNDMKLSPLRSGHDARGASPPFPPVLEPAEGGEGESSLAVKYGSTDSKQQALARAPPDSHLSMQMFEAGKRASESQPLIGSRDVEDPALTDGRDSPTLKHLVSNVFSSLRSDSTGTVEAENTESEKYLMTNFIARAFPERFFALLVTLVVEIPVLLMISGGSDQLCKLIGRRRYQLMMGFLPLSSAISGNCGLQASTLTTRAVSHSHVTKTSYLHWLGQEVAAAGCLGMGMGCVLGTYAYIVSGMDFAFGMTIFMAQFISIVTAGCTGTLAPLIFSFIFHRDSALYGGPLETAVQDIVGSFAMVVLSYRLLVFFGPMEVSADDVCGEKA